MNKIITLLLISFSLSGLGACNFLFKQPTLEKVHEVKLLALNPDAITLDLTLSLLNPNRYQLTLKELDIDLLNRDRERIGAASLQQEVVIPKRKSNVLNFRITLQTRPTVKMVNRSDQQVYVYIAGQGRAKVLGFNKNFDFETPYEIDAREHLQAMMAGFQVGGEDIFVVKRSYVSKVGLTESQIRVEFLILNPYGLEFRLKAFPATITLGGKEAGSGDLEAGLVFDETVFARAGTMVFKVNNWKTVVNAVKGVLNGEIAYQVRGEAQIEAYGMKLSSPYNYQDQININLSELIF